MTTIEDDAGPWLSGRALTLYRHLEARGDIARLKHSPQLGVVAWEKPAIRHSRWAYVARIMEHIRLVSWTDRVFGRFGQVQVRDVLVDAGRDLLDCWALLGSVGHLQGTFATERLVLDALIESNRARNLFMEAMPAEDRAEAEGVLSSYLIYELHPILAAVELNVSNDLGSNSERACWLEFLRALRNPPQYDVKVVQLAAAYRELRRFAYLSLDLQYADLPMSMDIGKLQSRMPEYLQELVTKRMGPLQALLFSLNTYIRSEIYLSPDVVLRHAQLRRDGAARVREWVDGAGSVEELVAVFRKMRDRATWAAVEAPAKHEFRHFCRIKEPRGFRDDRDSFFAQIPTRADALQTVLGSRCLSHVVVGMDGTEMLSDIYVPVAPRPGDLATAINAVGRTLIPSDPRGAGANADVASRGGKVVQDLIANLLAPMLKHSHRFRLEGPGAFGGEEACWLVNPRGVDKLRTVYEQRRSRLRKGLLSAEAGSIAAEKLRSRMHELEVLWKSLEMTTGWNFRIVMFEGFEVVWPTRDSHGIAEFDGSHIDLTDSEVRLWLVEAKIRGDRSVAAQESSVQLGKALVRLGWQAAVAPQGFDRGARVSLILGR